MKELNEKQIKGVDIAVKSSSKKFPFIKGWRLVDDYMNYKSNLYIDLYLDWSMVKDFYKFEWNERYNKQDILDIITNTIGVLFHPSYSANSPKFEEKSEKSRLAKKEMEEYIDRIYENLPSDYQISWESEFPGKIYICNIRISEFLTYK